MLELKLVERSFLGASERPHGNTKVRCAAPQGSIANLQTTKSPAGPGSLFWNSSPIHPRNRPCGAKSLILKGINGVADGARTQAAGEHRGMKTVVSPL